MNNNINKTKLIESIKEGYKLAESQSEFAKRFKIKDENIEAMATSFLVSISDCKAKYPLSDEFINDSARFIGFIISKYDEWE